MELNYRNRDGKLKREKLGKKQGLKLLFKRFVAKKIAVCFKSNLIIDRVRESKCKKIRTSNIMSSRL